MRRLMSVVALCSALLLASLTIGVKAVDEVTWTSATVTGENTEYQAVIKYPLGRSTSSFVWFMATAHPDWWLTYNGSMFLSWDSTHVAGTYTAETPMTPTLGPGALGAYDATYCPTLCSGSGDNMIIAVTTAMNTNSDWSAVWHVGHLNGTPSTYPIWEYSSVGSQPAFVTSTDGKTWHYRGKITVESTFNPTVLQNSNASAFVRNTLAPSTLDTTNFGHNRYLNYESNLDLLDDVTGDPYHVTMALLYSNDPLSNWYFARGSDGRVFDVWPSDLAGDTADYATVAFQGDLGSGSPRFHMLATANKDMDVTIRHIYSCDGWHFRTLETSSDTYVLGNGPFHIGMMYFNNRLYAYNGNTQFLYIGPGSHTCP